MIMKKLLLLFPLLLSCLWGIAADEFRVAELRCEYRDNPLAINTLTPQFSWQTLSVGRGFLQAGYQIQVASDPADLARGRKLLWDEQRKSDVSLHVRYAGRTLKPGQRYYWRVRVSDAAGNYSPWSEIRSFAVGLLDGSDWDGARWIAFEELPDSLRVVPGQEFNKIKIGDRKTALNRLPQFRREVKVTKPGERATGYVIGLNLQEYPAYIGIAAGVLAAIAIGMLVMIIVTGKWKEIFAQLVPVVLTAAIPFVWIIAVQHHSALHARFTFRILSVAAAAAITFIVLNVKQAKKQQKSQKIFKKAQ